MNDTKKRLLADLLHELRNERLLELQNQGYDITNLKEEELYEIDDGLNLIESIDQLLWTLGLRRR